MSLVELGLENNGFSLRRMGHLDRQVKDKMRNDIAAFCGIQSENENVMAVMDFGAECEVYMSNANCKQICSSNLRAYWICHWQREIC